MRSEKQRKELSNGAAVKNKKAIEKLIAIILMLLMSVTLAGCGGYE